MSYWYQQGIAAIDSDQLAQCREAQAAGFPHRNALGNIGDACARLSVLQNRVLPALSRPAVVVFGADHGVVAEGVSVQSQDYTRIALADLVTGSAALCRLLPEGVPLEVVDMGTAGMSPAIGARDYRLGPGTGNICREPAMTAEQCQAALQVGADVVDAIADCDVLLVGDVGVGSTTVAAAMAIAHTRLAASQMTGPGSGLDVPGVDRKSAAVTRALSRHLAKIRGGEDILQLLGGFEVAAMAGAYLQAARRGVPSLVDGYVGSAAAMSAIALNPALAGWLFYGHCSSEPGHRRLLSKLNAVPLLDLELNMGEAVGAAMALPVLQQACRLVESPMENL